jgi:ABC-type sugar transport system ATPase subunit
MIELRGLAIRQGAFEIAGISLQVPNGRYGVLMGKTGCGKTTLLEAIAGLRRAAGGQVLLAGRDVTNLAPGDRGVGYVPQDAALFRTMTVYNHLAFALQLRAMKRPAVHERVQELATWLGITRLLQRRPPGLSGGETQRVALGRALSFRPRYLLLDEPLSSLDDETRGSMIELLNNLRKSGGVTVLHVTHNSSEAAQLADVRFRLIDGKLVSED